MLGPLLSSAHVFSEIVGVKPPNKGILARVVERQLHLVPDIKPDPTSLLSFTALGYSTTNLHGLVARDAPGGYAERERRRYRLGIDTNAEAMLSGADFDAAQVDFISGIVLLDGYSGGGKTLLASAVARECELNFISVKGPRF
ncbi:hypothetical protein HWV62_15657 [Athelia sp. TMB]|nr:hypothetical protein HWV62_15657 [Athelia sp. TMB]